MCMPSNASSSQVSFSVCRNSMSRQTHRFVAIVFLLLTTDRGARHIEEGLTFICRGLDSTFRLELLRRFVAVPLELYTHVSRHSWTALMLRRATSRESIM